jgi:hypothetical protein
MAAAKKTVVRKTATKTAGKKTATKTATKRSATPARALGTADDEWTPPTSAQEQARKPRSGNDTIPDPAWKPGSKEANSIP